jgi:hypothetical protein
MKIFNIELFSTDAEWFCNLSKSEQITYIKNNTNQLDDNLINEFLASPLKVKDEYCFACRDKKEKISIAKIVENGNISKGNELEVETVTEQISPKRFSKRRNNK